MEEFKLSLFVDDVIIGMKPDTYTNGTQDPEINPSISSHLILNKVS
jgi:hypothetical protein